MSKYKISFNNHSSIMIDDGNVKILTDPWFISPAFGSWFQSPSPNYEDIEKRHKMISTVSHEQRS